MNSAGEEVLSDRARPIQYMNGCPLSGLMKGNVSVRYIHILRHPDGSVSAIATHQTEVLSGGEDAYALVNCFGGYFFKIGIVREMKDNEVDERSFICEELKSLLMITIQKKKN